MEQHFRRVSRVSKLVRGAHPELARALSECRACDPVFRGIYEAAARPRFLTVVFFALDPELCSERASNERWSHAVITYVLCAHCNPLLCNFFFHDFVVSGALFCSSSFDLFRLHAFLRNWHPAEFLLLSELECRGVCTGCDLIQ